MRLESVAEVNGLYMSYLCVHVQDMVDVEQKEAIKINARERKKGRRKRKTKVNKVTKPTKKELTRKTKRRV